MRKQRCHTCGGQFWELQHSKQFPGKLVCGGCASHEPLKIAQADLKRVRDALQRANDENRELVAEVDHMKREWQKRIDKAYEDGRAHQAKLEVQGRDKFLGEINERLSKKTRSRDGDMVRQEVTSDDILAALRHDNAMTLESLKA